MTPVTPDLPALLLMLPVVLACYSTFVDSYHTPTLEERTRADGLVEIDRAQMQRDCYTTMSIK